MSRFYYYDDNINNKDSAVIILGDAGLNTGYEQDSHIKNKLDKLYKGYIYCVRGNHELRPSGISDMQKIWDPNVSGYVYIQKRWPRIRYFEDYAIYWIENHRVLVIGGAYSVDKHWRLLNGNFWVEDEQLSEKERDSASRLAFGESFDFILTHTCPITFQPTDLFLNTINQSTVDHTMENFLEEIKSCCEWKIWCFGHYHDDRCERPRVQMFYFETESIDTIWNRWEGEKTIQKEWWIPKSPNYYIDGNEYEVKDE